MPVTQITDMFGRLQGRLFQMYKNIESTLSEPLTDESGLQLQDGAGRYLDEDVLS